MIYKDFFAPNKIEYVKEIENVFLTNGLERMSKYFYDIVFENNVPAHHILCSTDICGEYETLDSFTCTLTEYQTQNNIKSPS